MTIYLDADYKCHTSNDGTMTEVETAFFDGKCKTFIEGYRYVPAGEVWTREDGMEFPGEMVSPWREYTLLSEFQAQYEELLAEQEDMQAALAVLEVNNE
nr:MAG TPA: hypothetical protein [Caudoviricetes sp.]